MRDSDWSRKILLRSDWLGPLVATMTTYAQTSEIVNAYVENIQFPEHIARRFTISSRHSCTMFSRLKPWEKRRIVRHWFEES